jgi:IS30 family transposase
MKKAHVELSLSERKIIEEGCKNGSSYREMARRLGRSHYCIRYEIIKNGGKEKYSADFAQENNAQRKEERKRKVVGGLTDKQMEILVDCIQQGANIAEIRLKVGCSYNTVRNHFNKMGIEIKRRNYSNFLNRIEALESHVELILDILKDKANDKGNL